KNLRTWQHAKGAVPSSFDCWLALRGVQSLSARVTMQCSSAKIIADFLEAHEKIEAVYYPGLKRHSGHDIAATQKNGFGSLLYLKSPTLSKSSHRQRVSAARTLISSTVPLLKKNRSEERRVGKMCRLR